MWAVNKTNESSPILSCIVLGVSKVEYGYIKGLHEMLMLATCTIALPTALANALLLISIYRNKNLQTPAYILLCGLALTDLSVGIIIEPLYVSSLAAAIQGNILKSCRLREFGYRFSYFFTSCSVIIVTCISVERWLIIHGKFSKLVTKRRILGVLATTAVVSFVLDSGWSWFPSAIALQLSAAGLLFCVMVITLAYGRIFYILRACKARIVSSNTKASKANRAKYRHSVLTTVYIVTACFACLLPYVCRNIIRSFVGYSRTVFIFDHVSVLIVFLNSLINPALCFWRTKEIRTSWHSCMITHNGPS